MRLVSTENLTAYKTSFCVKMSRRPDIISGEASESDSEEEINSPATTAYQISQEKLRSLSTPRGTVVAGEAPESDEEELDASSVGVSSVPLDGKRNVAAKGNKHRQKLQHKSLLHRKLHERNVWLRKDVTEFVRQTIATAGQKLNTTNQQLLRSQIQLQEAVTALHALHNDSTQLNNKLAAATSVSFIPQIKIPD